MKKIISSLLCLFLLPCFFLCSCANKSEGQKFGMGIYSYYSSVSSADADKNGGVTVLHTAAAVLIDKNGKIIDIDLDSAECTGGFTADGRFAEAEKFLTKSELGDGYAMSEYGTDRNGDGTVLEWYKQAEAFEDIAKGKTLDEIKALAAGSYGTDEVVKAGCTISVSDFIKAIEKAFINAKAFDGKAEEAELGIVSAASSPADASADKNGTNNIDTYFAAAIKDGSGKVTALHIDCAEAEIKFDINGSAVTSVSDVIVTKNELGADYGMSGYGTDRNGDGTVLEWFKQAEAFASACIGKTAAQIAGLIGSDGYAAPDVQSAGCTIYISDMAKAAVKAAE